MAIIPKKKQTFGSAVSGVPGNINSLTPTGRALAEGQAKTKEAQEKALNAQAGYAGNPKNPVTAQANTGKTKTVFNKDKSVDYTDVFGNKTHMDAAGYNRFLQSQGGGTSSGNLSLKKGVSEGYAATPEIARAAENQARGEQGLSSLQDVETAIALLSKDPEEREFNEDKAGAGELAGGMLANFGLGGGGLALSGAVAGAAAGGPVGALVGAVGGVVVSGIGSILKKVSDDEKQNVAIAGANAKTAHSNMKSIIYALNQGTNAIEAAEAFQEELQTIQTSERFLRQKIIDDPVFWDTKAKNQLAYIETFYRRLPFLRAQMAQAMQKPNPDALPPQPEEILNEPS